MATVRNSEQTRAAILTAAFDEIHHHGFQGARLDRLLPTLGLTKGALYHHFPDKNAVGFAIIDEIIKQEFQTTWIEPLANCEDPIKTLRGILDLALEMHLQSDEQLERGCPCFNLAQEMSPLDEGFRERLEAILEERRSAIASALKRGIRTGHVRKGTKPMETADFVIASVQGYLASGMLHRKRERIVSGFKQVGVYLEGLRPEA